MDSSRRRRHTRLDLLQELVRVGHPEVLDDLAARDPVHVDRRQRDALPRGRHAVERPGVGALETADGHDLVAFRDDVVVHVAAVRERGVELRETAEEPGPIESGHAGRAPHEAARASYRALGRRVSLSAPAVRDRLRRLEGRGIFQGYMISVDPSLLDRDELLVFFQGEWTREGAQEALAVADVAWVAWKLDGGLSVQTWPRDRARTVRELTARLGTKPSGQALAERREPRPVSSLEWRIVDALIDDPRRPLQELTAATGLSPKTVRRHLERLLSAELLFITPRLGSLGDSGELVYTAAVFGAVPMADLRRALGDVFLINELQEPPARFLLCRGIDLGDVTTRIARVGKLPGIASVNVSLNREIIVSPDLLRRVVREQIEKG